MSHAVCHLLLTEQRGGWRWRSVLVLTSKKSIEQTQQLDERDVGRLYWNGDDIR